jgi:histidine triad (HIT) family protein
MERESDCLFCKMGNGEIAVDMLHQDGLVFAIADIAPRAPVHVLIIPHSHIASARQLEPNEHGPLLGHMVSVANKLAGEFDIDERGYRLAFNVGEEGGQTIYHLHMHLLGGRPLAAEG